MIKHLFKLIWNRKRNNYLVMLEIFLSYVVLFSVMIMVVFYLNIYNKPLGYDYINVWSINISYQGDDDTDEARLHNKTVYKQLLASLSEFDQIESYSGISISPFGNSEFSRSIFGKNGSDNTLYMNDMTDDSKTVLGINLLRGRWFSKEDNGADYSPVVINKRAAQIGYGNEDPLGKDFWEVTSSSEDKASASTHRKQKIIGIIEDFRNNGELSTLAPYAIYRKDMEAKTLSGRPETMPNNILIKVRGGTTAAFEETLIKRLQPEAKDWTFEIKPLGQMRNIKLDDALLPLYGFAIIAGFLIIMVALGLSGVLWLNVTQRTQEMGLRRACGAARKKIHRQILGELFMTTTIALIAGVLVVVQFPLLNILGFADWKVYTISVVISVLIIYGLTAICGLYPSRMATKIHPADALHYE